MTAMSPYPDLLKVPSPSIFPSMSEVRYDPDKSSYVKEAAPVCVPKNSRRDTPSMSGKMGRHISPVARQYLRVADSSPIVLDQEIASTRGS